jgi:hypothetical protein
MNCCICGPVKNCGAYLNKVLENIEKVGSLFDDYTILIYYDQSSDNSLQILKEYQNKNPRLNFYVNSNPTSKFRTHNIAVARNFCLNFIRNNKEKYPFFIMMDFDDVNSKEVNVNTLGKYLRRGDWDGLSFNTSPLYYDIWALSIKPYYFSYLHFKQSNIFNHDTLKKYIDSLLKRVPNGGLLKCLSAFNGFSIYRTSKFLNTYYDGRLRKDLLSKNLLDEQAKVTNSKMIYNDYGTVNGHYEDCEHRSFHLQAIRNSGARIMISPEIIFS